MRASKGLLLAGLLCCARVASADVVGLTWAPPTETDEATPRPLTGALALRGYAMGCDHTAAELAAHEGNDAAYLYHWLFDASTTTWSADFPVGSYVCGLYAHNDFGWSMMSNGLAFSVAPPPPPTGAPPKPPKLSLLQRVAQAIGDFLHRLFS